MHKYSRWKIDNDYFKTEDYKLNNNIASIISEKGYEEISKKFTHIKPHEIEDVLNLFPKVYQSLQGFGIDIGGGVASVSSVVAKSNLVKNIICLEITENCVTKCHPIVINKILGRDSLKVSSVIGDFDNLELDDKSLNFAIAWDALHHSNNVVKTLNEINRVLIPGGYFVLIDRAHNNNTPDSEIDRMLNVQYSKEFLKDNYLPEDKILTRSDNGEHEYRYNEWEKFFKSSNFTIEESFIVIESSKENKIHNDVGIKEVFVDYELGGFERQKVIYLLKK
tara:strand:+ start:3255 stop:4091 length:837 start_codon:yes stop_codon:yes gene_type:complete